MSEVNKIRLEDAGGQLIAEYDLVGTDTKVTQTETTTDAEYEILFSGTADNTTRTEGAGKNEGMTYNANHKALTIGTRYPNSTIGDYSVSNGSGNIASGAYSHAEGAGAMAIGQYSHCEGGGNSASGMYSHAEGGGTAASGDYGHAEGGGTTASGMYSHCEGGGTVANHAYQHVFGMYNTPDPSSNSADQKGTYIEIVGNGTINGSTLNTSNARTLDWSGNETLKGNLTVGGTSISVNGNSVAHSGNVATGDSNGQVKIAGTNVSVKGLGSRAYDSTAYVPASGGTFTGGVTFNTTPKIKSGINIGLDAYAAGSTTQTGALELYNGNYVLIDFHWKYSTSDWTFRITQHAADTLEFYGHDASTWGTLKAKAFSVQSSLHVKENIEDITEEEASKLLQLRPVSFDYKNSETKNQRGLIAEEVMEIYPEMVEVPEGYTEFNPDDPSIAPSIDYSKFVPYLIKLCQTQQSEINALKNKIERMEEMING